MEMGLPSFSSIIRKDLKSRCNDYKLERKVVVIDASKSRIVLTSTLLAVLIWIGWVFFAGKGCIESAACELTIPRSPKLHVWRSGTSIREAESRLIFQETI